MTEAAGWRLERRRGSAAALHRPWPEDDARGDPVAAVCQVTAPAVVLGSTQAVTTVDHDAAAAAGIEVARRGSGGGAVLVDRHAQVWIDAWLPRGHQLWDDDIVRAPQWLGDVWAGALADLGAAELRVHDGRSLHTHWSSTVCFAGIGPGEVTVAGRKVVGLSQRRSRHGARISTMAMDRWDAATLCGLLSATPAERARMVADVTDVAVGLQRVVARTRAPSARLDAVVEAVLARLP